MKNKHVYEISIQHVKPGIKFDDDYQKLLKEKVIPSFNARSLIAKNPKEIKSYEFSDDQMTLTVKLESKEELPMPSKALRLISTYLVNDTMIGEGDYLAGKQLFKMASSSVDNKEDKVEKTVLVTNDNGTMSVNMDCLEIMQRVVDRTAKLVREGDFHTILKYLGEEC